MGGGGGVQRLKDHDAGQSSRISFLCLFCSSVFFYRKPSKSTFFSKFGQKCALKKEQKKIMSVVFLTFSVLFCSFYRIWSAKCPQTENKKEQKRSGRRENRKMSFVFFVVGPPPPLDSKLEGPE